MEELILKEDLVIPAGTRFRRGPVATSYGSGNYEAIISLSDDETATFTVFTGEPATDALFEEE